MPVTSPVWTLIVCCLLPAFASQMHTVLSADAVNATWDKSEVWMAQSVLFDVCTEQWRDAALGGL